MTIGGVSCGPRSSQASRGWLDWVNFGLSTAGVITRVDFGKREYDVPILFQVMPTATVLSLESALKTAKVGGSVSVTPDTDDDLGIGASGAVNLTLLSYKAEHQGNGFWVVSILFRYYE